MINYKITNQIVGCIENISSIWWVIENAKIVPEWEQKLKRIARIRSWVYSTRIEWNQIDYEQAESFLGGWKIDARERDKKELKNYMNVLDYIEEKESDKNITENDIFKIHALTTKWILSKWLQNKYRDQQNAIYDKSWVLVYMPPESKDVSNLMTKLLDFINKQNELSPLIRAWILHHWFVIIHPFIDWNWRTARALTQLFLYQKGYNTKKYFSLEEYYDNDLNNYYEAINIWNDYYNSFEISIDSTSFTEYFLKWLELELSRLKKQIKSIKEEESFENILKSQDLDNRQVHIMLYIKEQWKIKSENLLNEFDISISTAKRELKNLLDKDLLKMQLKGKNTCYELNMSWIWAE